VHLRVDRDGSVTSRLVVERPETLDLLRRDAPSLERALQNAGLKTGEQGLQFSLRDQTAERQRDNNHAPRGSRVVIPDEVQPRAGATYGRWLGLGAGLDIRV
jgi:chemotaxis protein MotD